MKKNKLQVVVFSGALALSAVTMAETGKGYIINTVGEPQVMADGTIVHEVSSDSVWVMENRPEGFPSLAKGRCTDIRVMGPDYSNKGSTWRCTAIDGDGDGFVNVGRITGADWSECSFEMVAGWGKYAGASISGTCQPTGPFAGPDTGTVSWTGEWTLPE
jgi:hypothetical protein